MDSSLQNQCPRCLDIGVLDIGMMNWHCRYGNECLVWFAPFLFFIVWERGKRLESVRLPNSMCSSCCYIDPTIHPSFFFYISGSPNTFSPCIHTLLFFFFPFSLCHFPSSHQQTHSLFDWILRKSLVLLVNVSKVWICILQNHGFWLPCIREMS